MRELPDGVITWTWFSAPHGYDFNGYFVRHADGNLCIDPVEPDAEVLALLAREGVARIVLTNRNHGRRAALVRERTGAPVAIHPDDATHARAQGVPIDAALRPGEQLGPFTVVGVPGSRRARSPSTPPRRVLVVGDAVIGNPPGRLALLREGDGRPAAAPGERAPSRRSTWTCSSRATASRFFADAGARLRELVATFPPDGRLRRRREPRGAEGQDANRNDLARERVHREAEVSRVTAPGKGVVLLAEDHRRGCRAAAISKRHSAMPRVMPLPSASRTRACSSARARGRATPAGGGRVRGSGVDEGSARGARARGRPAA